MFRKRGENLHSIYILLFLNVAFFFLEVQDPQRYARLFAFDADAVRSGQVWRLVTYQFTQSGPGNGMVGALWMFFALLILYFMGSALEEEGGTFHFLALYGISTMTTALAAALLGTPLMGTYFISFTLLYVFASAFPHQQLMIFGIIPLSVRLLAGLSLAYLLYGVFMGGRANLAALAGAVAGYIYYLLQRQPSPRAVIERKREEEPAAAPARDPRKEEDAIAVRNAARFVAMKRAIANRSDSDIDRLISQCDRDTVRGVNICPPVDYKPEHNDGYCIRCEGFAECSARYLKANRTKVSEPPPGSVPEPTA